MNLRRQFRKTSENVGDLKKNIDTITSIPLVVPILASNLISDRTFEYFLFVPNCRDVKKWEIIFFRHEKYKFQNVHVNRTQMHGGRVILILCKLCFLKIIFFSFVYEYLIKIKKMRRNLNISFKIHGVR